MKVKRSCYGLFKDTIPILPGEAEENHKNTIGKPVYGLRFESRTS
jgi:hypothetical protein